MALSKFFAYYRDERGKVRPPVAIEAESLEDAMVLARYQIFYATEGTFKVDSVRPARIAVSARVAIGAET